jgi:thioredoxin reductase (NADPH)
VKYWLRPDIDNRIKAGEIRAIFSAQVSAITRRAVSVRSASGEETVPADRVYALTGYHPDFALLRSIGIGFDEVSGRPSLSAETLETNVPGVFLAGSVGAGRNISEVFIENGRFDGEKIFGDPASRAAAEAKYGETLRPVGE